MKNKKSWMGILFLGGVMTVTSVYADDRASIELNNVSSIECHEAISQVVSRLESAEQHLAGYDRSMIDVTGDSEHPSRESSMCRIELKSQNANIGFFWKETPRIRRVTRTTDDACIALEADLQFDGSNIYTERKHSPSGFLLPPSHCWVRYLQLTTLH